MYAKPPTALAACTDFAAMQYVVLVRSSYELCVTFLSPLAGLMFTFAFLELKHAEPDLLASCKIITH